MKFALVALVVGAIVATVLLLIVCLKRWRSSQTALKLDPAAQHLLMEEGVDEARTGDVATLGYERLSDALPDEGTQKVDKAISQPQRSRHPLAAQYSALAASVEPPAPWDPMHTREFQHEMKLNDEYIWSTKGGTASPMKVDWGSKPSSPKQMLVDTDAQQKEPSNQQQDVEWDTPDKEQDQETEEQQNEQQKLVDDEGPAMKEQKEEEPIVKTTSQQPTQRAGKGKKNKHKTGTVKT